MGLVDTARPSSPSGDQGRHEYRRSGYDKQGEVGAGSARPEFVSLIIEISRKKTNFIYLFSVVVMAEVVNLTVIAVVPNNNKQKK